MTSVMTSSEETIDVKIVDVHLLAFVLQVLVSIVDVSVLEAGDIMSVEY